MTGVEPKNGERKNKAPPGETFKYNKNLIVKAEKKLLPRMEVMVVMECLKII